jgi:hypothetical protein
LADSLHFEWRPYEKPICLVPLCTLLLILSAFSVNAHAIEAIIDTDEVRTTPVQHRYIHGVILDDANFQILLPVLWNGEVVIHPRGFSRTEFNTGANGSDRRAERHLFSRRARRRSTVEQFAYKNFAAPEIAPCSLIGGKTQSTSRIFAYLICKFPELLVEIADLNSTQTKRSKLGFERLQ